MKVKKKTIVTACMLGAMLLNMAGDFTAEAKKKAAAGPDPAIAAEAELKKNLEPIAKQLTDLQFKIQSRELLSPKDAGQLAELKYQLLDIVNQNPQNVLIAKPLYQAGIIYSEREEYNDAYELFSYLSQGFPTNPYGGKAKGQIQQLEKRFGPGYFAIEAAAASTTNTATAMTAGSPGTPGTAGSVGTPGTPGAAPGAATPAAAAVPAAPAAKK